MFKAFASGAIFVTLLWVSPSSSHESVNVQISALGAKIQKDPKNPSLYLERADLQRREKHYAEALRDLDRAQKLAPERKDIVLERGLTLAAKGDTEEAEKLLSKYLAMGSRSAKAFVARGKIRESALRYADARSDYAAAVALEPQPDSFLARGRMDEALGHWDDAVRGYEEGLRMLSGAVVLRLALVRVEQKQGHYERVIAVIDEILPKLPLKADWLLLRADAHEGAGRTAEARKDREAALREADERIAVRPTDYAAIARVKALRALGRREEALREIEIVVQHAPKLDEARTLRDEIRAAMAGKR